MHFITLEDMGKVVVYCSNCDWIGHASDAKLIDGIFFCKLCDSYVIVYPESGFIEAG